MINKQRILIVINEPLRKGGNQNVIVNIIRNLSNKYVFDVLSLANDYGYYDDEVNKYGGNVYKITRNIGSKNKLLKKIYYIFYWVKNKTKLMSILENDYNSIFCTNDYDGWYLLKLAYKHSIPIRVSYVAKIVTKGNFLIDIYHRFCLNRIKKYATVCASCSTLAAKEMYKKNFVVIPNTYDDKFNNPITKKEFEAPQIVHVASYSDNKNQLFSIKVFNEILKKYPSALMNVVGFEGEEGYLRKMKDLIDNLKIQSNICFHDSTDDTLDILDNSTHLLLPSKKEAFGIVLLEGQARGLKCIASDSVPKDANVGGCVYLPIDDSEKLWTEYIINDFEKNKGKHFYYDLNKFSNSNIMLKYENLFNKKRNRLIFEEISNKSSSF